MDIKIKKIRDTAIIPTRGSKFSAGYDLYANIEQSVVIKAGETVKIPTGIATEIPIGHVALIFARSGLATNKGLAPANAVGVVDGDYRGEWIVALHNHNSEAHMIHPEDRIAQVVFMPFDEVDFAEVTELPESERGSGGFGSTGA